MRRVVLAALVLLVGLAPAARASSVLQTAWWWQPQQGSLPAPPFVPAGGLLVQGLPDGPAAVAAVRVALDPGTSRASLVLPVEGTVSAGVAQGVVLACTVTGDWSPGPAQPWSDRPASDCRHALVGKVTDAEVSFDLGPRQVGAVLDLAIVPGELAPGVGSTFTAVFTRATVRTTSAPVAVPTTSGAEPVAPAPAFVAPPVVAPLAGGAAPLGAPLPTTLPTAPVAVPPAALPATPSQGLASAAVARSAAPPRRAGWWLLLLGLPLVRLLWRPPSVKEQSE